MLAADSYEIYMDYPHRIPMVPNLLIYSEFCSCLLRLKNQEINIVHYRFCFIVVIMMSIVSFANDLPSFWENFTMKMK